MSLLIWLRNVARNLLHRKGREEELHEELVATRDLIVAEKLQEGLTVEAARRVAVLELGGLDQLKEGVRDGRAGARLEALLQDLRHTSRSLARSPGFTVLVTGTLAVGLGLNVAVLAVTYGILIRPLPYADPSRLAIVTHLDQQGLDARIPPVDAETWLGRLTSVAGAAAYQTRELTIREGAPPRVIQTARVTDRFFAVLGTAAQYGRAAERLGRHEAIVSHRLASQLAFNPNEAIGRSLSIGPDSYSIVGVMPAAFGFPAGDVDAWILAPGMAGASPAESGYYRVLARAGPDVALPQFRDEVQRLFKEIKPRFPGTTSVTFLGDALLGDIRPVLHVSLAAALLVLLVACANVTTLFIGRAVARHREMAVRTALGAGWRRLARAIAVEMLIVASLASMVGTMLGFAALRVFVREGEGVVPRLGEVGLDFPSVAAVPLLTVIVTLLCGVLPAWHLRRGEANPFLGTQAVRRPAVWRIRSALVIAQIALSIVLLIGAGLMTRSVLMLMRENPGFDPSGALAVKLVLSDRMLGDSRSSSFVSDLLDRIRALPGVQHAGLGSNLPPREPPMTIGMRFTNSDGSRDEFTFMKLGSATPGYLRALGAPIASGRDFTDADAKSGHGAAVLSETAVRYFFPGEDPIGRPINRLPPIAGSATPIVVGVVPDAKYEGLDSPADIVVYVTWGKRPVGTAYLIVRTAGDPMSLAPAVREIIRSLDSSIPVPEIRSVEDVMAGSIADRRLRAMPALGIGLLALALSLIGLAGTLSRVIGERRQELAVRSALGAGPRQLAAYALGRGAMLAGGGMLCGIAASVAVVRLLARLLYGVSPIDPPTFAVVALLVGAGALAASYVPARRAIRTDPVADLRYE